MADTFNIGGRNYRSASGKPPGQTGAEFGVKIAGNIGKAVYVDLQDVLRDSLPLVPVDTGALRGSGYVEEPITDGFHVTCEVGYGGVATKINPKTLEPSSAYALQVHENLDAHHKVGQAKYLQVPFDAATPGMPQRIAARLKGSQPQQSEDNSGGGSAPE